jgi:uracil-DNA glycosylase
MKSDDTRRTLASLHHGIRRCRKCRLCETRRRAVPGEGPADARIMLIGEAPGEKEDAAGTPFLGRSGRFLDELLESSGLERAELYITSSVKCRPPGNRDPRPDERSTCREAWLVEQIALVDPRLLVLTGKVAVRQVLGYRGSLKDLHGRLRQHEGRRVLPTYHPAAGMRFPDIAARMRKDFRMIRRLVL